MPSADEVARMAKDNLRHSLMIAHNLTIKSSDPSDFILHRMNDALGAVTDTCFGNASMVAVGALYEAIGEVQHLVANTHDLALVNVSRSFAVVLEEAIKMKAELNGVAGNNNIIINNNNNGTSAISGGPWGNTAQNSGIDSRRPLTGVSGLAINRSNQSVDMRGKSAAPPTSAALPQGQSLNGKPAAAPWAAEVARRKEKEEQKDYSPEAIKGRVTIRNIPTAVTEQQLREHFGQRGEIIDFSYPLANGKRKGFALMKFKDNETADEVCGHLNGVNLGGAALVVERAKYWHKTPAFGTGRANAGSGPASGTDSRLASASSSKIDANEVD